MQHSKGSHALAIEPDTSSFQNKHYKIADIQFGVEYSIDKTLNNRLSALELALFRHETDAQTFLDQSLAHASQQQSQQNLKYDARTNHSGPHTNKYRLTQRTAHPFLKPPLSNDSLSTEEQITIKTQKFSKTHATAAYSVGRRPAMEDRHVSTQFSISVSGKLTPVFLNAVIDGHGSDVCAAYVKQQLKTTLANALKTYGHQSLSKCNIVNALIATTVILDQNYNTAALSPMPYIHEAGSTLNFSAAIGDKVYCVNVGDSRSVFISQSGKVTQLTPDHTLQEAGARQEVIARNGFIAHAHGQPRALGRLAMSRAIGNHWANGAISARPSITCFDKTELAKGYLVHACDGLFEIQSTQAFGEHIFQQLKKEVPLNLIAEKAVDRAFKKGSRDNLTVLIQPIDSYSG